MNRLQSSLALTMLGGCLKTPVDRSLQEGRDSLNALVPSIEQSGYTAGDCAAITEEYRNNNAMVRALTQVFGEQADEEQVACLQREGDSGKGFVFLSQNPSQRTALFCPPTTLSCSTVQVPNHFDNRVDADNQETFFRERVVEAAAKADPAPLDLEALRSSGRRKLDAIIEKGDKGQRQ